MYNTDLSDHGIVKAYSGDAVINSDWVSAGTVVYKVLNGTCFVDFDITVKQITAINTLIVSGLPVQGGMQDVFPFQLYSSPTGPTDSSKSITSDKQVSI